jgi:RNA polymerase sigma factor (sigma-70 family)
LAFGHDILGGFFRQCDGDLTKDRCVEKAIFHTYVNMIMDASRTSSHAKEPDGRSRSVLLAPESHDFERRIHPEGRKMFEINKDNLLTHLELCHGALMRIWNQYRDQMNRRGYETADATQEVTTRVYAKSAEFKGKTLDEFCGWSKKILTRWILGELRRTRAMQMDGDHDASDSGQPRPSEVFQSEIRFAAYRLARAALPELERILIEFKYEQKLKVEEVFELLQRDYPILWETHQANWNSSDMLKTACQAAKQHLNDIAKEIHQQLETGSSDE